MKLSKAVLGIVLPVMLAGACATAVPIHQPMSPETLGKISSTEVILPIKQNEIYIFVPASQVATYGGGGLLLALVDAGINSANAGNAEQAVKPVRDALVDFSFDETLRTELNTALATTTPGLNPSGYKVVKEVTDANLDAALSASEASAVMFVGADYQLSDKSDAVTVSITPFLFPNSPELAAMVPGKPAKSALKTASDKSLYRNIISFRDRVPGAKADRAVNLPLWAANNGEAARASLKKGATRLAQMLVADLQAAPGPAIDPKTTTYAKITVDGLQGFVVSADEEGSLVRFPTGTQMYLTKAALAELPKSDPAPAKMSGRERAQLQKEQEKARRAAVKAAKEAKSP